MVRKKLLSFTDTKMEIVKRKAQFKKKGFTNLLVKKEYGAYGLYGRKGGKK